MRLRDDLRCLICVFPVFWDVRVLQCNAFLLKNQGTSLLVQYMELAPPPEPPEHPNAPRWTQQVNRPGAKVGPAVRASAVGGQRRVDTHLAGLALRGQLWVRRAPVAAVGEPGLELAVGDPAVDLKRVSDFQLAAFTVPSGVFVGVKIVRL